MLSAIHKQPSQQRGSALIVSLLMLVVLTLIGITAVGTSTLEEKMAGNIRDQHVAFQAAEVALRDAEDFIEGLASTAAFDGTDGLYPTDSDPDIDPNSATWTGSNSIVYSGTVGNAKSAPRYIIQLLGSQGNSDVNLGGYGDSSGVGAITDFRITAKGTGISDNSAVILQAYYGKRL